MYESLSRNSKTLVKELHQQYGFKEIKWLNNLGGFSSLNEKIFADGKIYVLKLASFDRRLHIEQLIDATIFLSKKGIPVSIPLITTANEYFFQCEENLCLVMPFIKGDILHEANLDETALSSAAHLLAEFHKAASSYAPQLPSSHKFIKSVSDIKNEATTILTSIHEKSHPDETDAQLIKNIQLKLQVLETLPSTEDFLHKTPLSSIVHGDFHNENILFNGTNAFHLLDFEEIRLGSRTEDIFHFIFLACCNSGFQTANLEKSRLFFQSYIAVYPFVEIDLYANLNFELYKMVSTFFLETPNAGLSRDLLLTLLVRDYRKISYLSNNITSFLEKISGF